MIFPVLELMQDADSYVCHWTNGELFIELANSRS
jgi:hypothetical protein